MKLFFLDDARQNTPSRGGMGPLVAVGALNVDSAVAGLLEREIKALCRNTYGFPPNEEFKWSPGRELWMRTNLVGDRRLAFFRDILQLVRNRDGKVIVAIEDTNCSCATDAPTAEFDVVRLCLERVCLLCSANPPDGLVIADKSLVGQPGDTKFLAACLESIQAGAGYIRPDVLALNVVSTPSKFVRLIQVSDLVTGATLAAVGGETPFSPPVVEAIKPLYRREYSRVGGCGVKIHPDFKYANLYHWVLGDRDFVRFQNGYPLPMRGYPYADDPATP